MTEGAAAAGGFSELSLSPALIQALAAQDIDTPTDIQRQAIPAILQGTDTYVGAETGTGKTLAYLLPLMQRLDAAGKALQVMVLSPTLELALQTYRQAEALAVATAGATGGDIRCLALIGGTSIKRQLEQLKTKPHLVSATPDRALELIGQRKLKMHEIFCMVVDEADRLLEGPMGQTAMEVIRAAPGRRQLVFASATVGKYTLDQARKLSPDLQISDTGSDAINTDIEHMFVMVEERKKPEMLRRLIHATQPERALVFTHRNAKAEELAEKLSFHDLRATWFHGAADRTERQRAMEDFRSGDARVLISSDLAARGLDLPDVTHVFNLDPPTQSQDYLHRAGRTGRAGKAGCCVLLLDPRERRLVARYARDLDIELQQVRLEGGRLVPQN